MFIKQYELDGDSKFVGEDGSRSHAIRHEFQSWKKSRCELRSVLNTKQRYNFGTQKFMNRKTMCKTLGVFNRS